MNKSVQKGDKRMQSKNKLEWPTIIIGTAIVLLLGVLMVMFPEQGVHISQSMFSMLTNSFGTLYMYFGLFVLIAVLYFALSKYGKVRLATQKPDFSKLQVLFMSICCGFGSATMYWIFMEGPSYFIGPPEGFEAYSVEAAEVALSYSFFNWGLIPWAMYVVCGFVVFYAFYVRKSDSYRLSDIFNHSLGGRVPQWGLKVVDIIFVVVSMGAVSVTLGLSIPMMSHIFSYLTGIPESFLLNVGFILLIAIIFTLSSYVGVGRGMKRLSDANMYLFILFLVMIFLASDKVFTLNYSTNAFGLFLTRFFKMTFETDPISRGGFPQAWVIFFFAYWAACAPATGVFIAKITKGHTIRDAILVPLLGGSLGGMLMFSIAGSYTMHLQFTDRLPVGELLETTDANELILQTLGTLPFSKVMMVLFCIIAILFVAGTLDGNAFSLSAVTSTTLDRNGNPHLAIKLYWCLILTLFPIVLTYAHADLDAIKNIALVVSGPMCIVILCMVYGTIRSMQELFGKMNEEEIEVYNRSLDQSRKELTDSNQ